VKAAQIVAAIGSTGSGKTAWVRQFLGRLKPARFAVFDIKREWSGRFGVPAVSDMRAFLRAVDKRAFAVAFVPSIDEKARQAQFDRFCLACIAAGNLTMLVEELPAVTSPSYAPGPWRHACLTGRDYTDGAGRPAALTIIGTAQRPALVDKQFFGNATLIHCGRLGYERDLKVMADELGVPEADIRGLADLEWIERDRLAGSVKRGKLAFGAKGAGAAKRGRKPG
jgi:hypothetical protein